MRCFEFIPEGIDECKVTAWIHGNDTDKELKKRVRPAMIICPGGGYGMVSEREAEPVAECYFAAGYQTFIVWYSVGEKAKDFRPLCQLASTIAHVRKHAEEWDVLPDKIAVSGFSAGGHLACSLGTLFNEERFLKAFGREEDIRPNAMVLNYPVIVADEFAHQGSIKNVSGEPVGSEGYKWFALDQHVDEQTPPAFLWHTAEDQLVPVENSLRMATALSAVKVPFELHILPKGYHGMTVCTEGVGSKDDYNGRWVEWSIKWLNKVFDFVR
ncbi:MAG: alpha/beta hydrolase [Tyzzerella sp.]|nr:alpha/beta hydrolase [Tyzzerella sp.]